MIGTVTGHAIGKNIDGDKNVILLQVQITDENDVQTVELFNRAGDDYIPPAGSRVIITTLAGGWKIGIAVDDGIAPGVNEGDRKIYSVSGGAIAAYIELLSSGVINVNGSVDFAVRYTALETSLQSLITKINAALAGKLDGSGTAGTIVEDFSGAKVDEVKLP